MDEASGPARPGTPASGSSHCTADCVSAIGSPERPSSPAAVRGATEKGHRIGPPPAATEAAELSTRERYLAAQNRMLKSTLIKTLEKLQVQVEASGRARRLLSQLLALRGSGSESQPGRAAGPPQDTPVPDDLYARYAALVKQNYQLEQALGRGDRAPTRSGRAELDEYRALVGIQMSTLQQDWRDERDEKERALALNAELHQQVEQLQHQLEQLSARRPLSEPFESLEPSFFTGSSSWGPECSVRSQPRHGIPPPGVGQTVRGLQSTRSASRHAPGPPRSVEEVLSAPYEAIRTEPLPPPRGRPSPPVESDIRRPLPPPGRQPSAQRRPAPLLARDSGYSDLLAAAPGDGSEPGRSASGGSAEGHARDWELPAEPRTALPPASADTGAAHQMVCPHCRTVFAPDQHLLYVDHVTTECPARRRRGCASRTCPG
ncbi:uncharacterized protein LOC122379522 [Amphibalanus amphitrite]|uniref:uncharacterized protein LOC122379522 n=1 Tax=Amphibalanus amphitrite TaxID=1232801 RepID=UPI001C907661|nr:uncharacterized protein LOC122379522 [Amphibalanus amphitrite]